jgi:CheY-like chemotaxis protein
MDSLVGKTILIIEDDELSREGLASVLRLEGCTPVLTADGKNALDYLKTSSAPDLILLDMLLPIMDGWSFLQCRKHDPGIAAIPVLILTGVPAASQGWAESLGAKCVVKKPIQVQHMIEEVKKYCS